MEINGFKSWDISPNTVSPKGLLLTKYFEINTNNDFKHRLVRVYLPSTYDFSNPDKRFPSLYMLDGKNLFDDYTSFVGEWNIDESIEKMIDEKVNEGIIVIGIDAPNQDIDRTLEMTIEGVKKSKYHAYQSKEGYAYLLSNFIFDVLKKEIDATFYTLSDKKHTGVGGSSMGGLMSFYLGLNRHDEIDYCLNFSPAFFLLNYLSLLDYVKKYEKYELPKMMFYVGGVGFEKVFISSTYKMYKHFLDIGYSNSVYIYDKDKEHNEKAWGEYFIKAFRSVNK